MHKAVFTAPGKMLYLTSRDKVRNVRVCVLLPPNVFPIAGTETQLGQTDPPDPVAEERGGERGVYLHRY